MNPLESQNDQHTKELASKVSRLKNIVIDIDNEAKEHHRFLDTMRFDFDTARGFLGGSARHLTNVMTSGRSDRRVMYYVIGGIVFTFIFLYYIVSSFRNKMKLILHNMLTSNFLKGVSKGFPLKIKVIKMKNVSVDYNKDFIIRILQYIKYDALRGAVNDLALKESLPEIIQHNDEFFKKLHKVLFEYEIEEGELICPETNRKFPIVKGIPNILNNMIRNRFYEKSDKEDLSEIKSKQIQLYSFESIPAYLQSNPYIRTGYRYGLNFKDCLFSLVYFSNESVNIWSHLIGAGLFIYFFLRDIYVGNALPFLTSTSDYYFVLFYTFSVITCMLCSVLFHLFGCISSRAFADFLKLDLCGIGLGILGCYLCGLHISFECYRHWRIRYETMIISIMFIAVIYYVHGVKRYITRNIHVALFVIIALLGFLPGFHWYYLHGGWTNEFVRHFFPKLFVLYGILGIGTCAYLFKFPERFFPGYFDFLFASHQIWHISSLGAFIWWYQNGVELLRYRLINPCE